MSHVTVDLLSNEKFKNFVASFNQLLQSTADLSLAEVRKRCTAFFLPPDTIFEPVFSIEDVEVPRDDQSSFSMRIFTPSDAKDLPVIVYYHRGGWVFGSVEESEPVCRKMANHLGCIVAAVEYRLCPENPFPKPLEDAYEAAKWMYEHTDRFGGDRNKLIVCGESCGGNLAAAVTLKARETREFSLAAQLLICPIITSSMQDAVYDACADQYFLTKQGMQFFWSAYVQSPKDLNNPLVSPDLAASFEDLPPAVIVTAEHDPLRLEAENYAQKLELAEVPVFSQCVEGVVHGFLDLPIYEEDQKIRWLHEIKALLKRVDLDA